MIYWNFLSIRLLRIFEVETQEDTIQRDYREATNPEGECDSSEMENSN